MENMGNDVLIGETDRHKDGPVLCAYEVTFKGIQAHAAAHPWDGRSAFDGMQMAFHGVEFLQKHMPSCAVYYTLFHNGGTPANVVPDLAQSMFYLVAPKREQLQMLSRRVEQIIAGAAKMTGTCAEAVAKVGRDAPMAVSRAANLPTAGETDMCESGDGHSAMPGLYDAVRQALQRERALSDSF